MENAIGFYMLGVGLVAYIFHKMDERSKDVPTPKVERKENQRELDKSDASSFKKSENAIKLTRRCKILTHEINKKELTIECQFLFIV
ncbi:hypothetical protein M3225_25300 [Priestia aryabhattai]|uniref:hypothetical protein n=1 Tax=Priestia aryabhattai TaxID=412384 RepID=UPI00203F5821|nr:hypothetical protein [Priestia aryabhattai]MCM3773763.1 hypothetical protein [Priestia aryabhattai]